MLGRIHRGSPPLALHLVKPAIVRPLAVDSAPNLVMFLLLSLPLKGNALNGIVNILARDSSSKTRKGGVPGEWILQEETGLTKKTLTWYSER